MLREREVLKPSAPSADPDVSGDGAQHYPPIAGALCGLPVISHGLRIPEPSGLQSTSGNAVRRQVRAHGYGSLVREVPV